MREGAEAANAGHARMAKAPRNAGVEKTALAPTKMAMKATTVHPTRKAAHTSSPLGPARGGETPEKHGDHPADHAVLHGVALLGCCPLPLPRNTQRARPVRRGPTGATGKRPDTLAPLASSAHARGIRVLSLARQVWAVPQ